MEELYEYISDSWLEREEKKAKEENKSRSVVSASNIEKRQMSGGKQQHSGGKQQHSGGKQQHSGGRQQHSGAKQVLLEKSQKHKEEERKKKVPERKLPSERTQSDLEQRQTKVAKPDSPPIQKTPKSPTPEIQQPPEEPEEGYLCIGDVKDDMNSEPEKEPQDNSTIFQEIVETVQPVQMVDVVKVPKKKKIPNQPEDYLNIPMQMMEPREGEEGIDDWVEKAGDESALEKIAPSEEGDGDSKTAAVSEKLEVMPITDPEKKREIFAKMTKMTDDEESITVHTEKRKKINRRKWVLIGVAAVSAGFLLALLVVFASTVPLIIRCRNEQK